ncbi:MAG: glycosyltransferase family 2 protein [Coriobacteriia bacterium]|nr:glycosyltransferase family 2 protein [Coriobacteriia bacterium]
MSDPTLFSYIFLGIQVGLLAFGCYFLVITFFGFGKIPKTSRCEPISRFLLLVPAHNEEAVIENLVDNLMNDLAYPKNLYTVCVIADNCTDDTAAIARSYGAEVIENTTPPDHPKGKPWAILAALNYVGDQLTDYYDAIAVFDADNLVDSNYLQRMNSHLLSGERVIQCYLDSKNPTDNHTTLGYAIAYYSMNRMWQLAKYRLGLPNAIGGTGFCIATSVIDEIGWTARSLTEDLEFTIQCIQHGIQVTWCHTTRVYDEKPVSFKASLVQRLRWCRGHWDVAFRYIPKLLFRAVTKLDHRALDGAIYLAMPSIMLIIALMWTLFFIGVLIFDQPVFQLLPLWAWIFLWILTRVYLLIFCSIDAEVKYGKIEAVLALMFFNLTYVPLSFWGMLTFRNKTWVRTEHTRAISHTPTRDRDRE